MTMPRSLPARTFLTKLIVVAVLTFSCGSLWAASKEDESFRAYVDKGKASFGLGKFADAAEAYEAAFAIKPAPALLYNAAQAHRMAGHKERALDLYQSYLRLYARTGANREESEKHVENLSKALADEKRVASAPPNDMAAEPDAPPPPVPTTPAAATPAAEPTTTGSTLIVARNEEPETNRPLTSNPWFWAGVGGVVVATAVVVLALTLGGSSEPQPTAGTIRGN